MPMNRVRILLSPTPVIQSHLQTMAFISSGADAGTMAPWTSAVLTAAGICPRTAAESARATATTLDFVWLVKLHANPHLMSAILWIDISWMLTSFPNIRFISWKSPTVQHSFHEYLEAPIVWQSCYPSILTYENSNPISFSFMRMIVYQIVFFSKYINLLLLISLLIEAFYETICCGDKKSRIFWNTVRCSTYSSGCVYFRISKTEELHEKPNRNMSVKQKL